MLAGQKGLEAVAVAAIEPAAKAMTDEHPAAIQSDRPHRVPDRARQGRKVRRGQGDRHARWSRLEAKLDAEYLKSVPPFKPTTFAGRKDTSANRVVMMELFTGAQCPPCVAADVAFDALLKAYKPTDLVLVQYHMHIPGSDPMTNPDTIARWDYYRKHYAENIRGVPSSLFNGKPAGGGGGGMSSAEGKFQQYTRRRSTRFWRRSSDVKLAGKASRVGRQARHRRRSRQRRRRRHEASPAGRGGDREVRRLERHPLPPPGRPRDARRGRRRRRQGQGLQAHREPSTSPRCARD